MFSGARRTFFVELGRIVSAWLDLAVLSLFFVVDERVFIITSGNFGVCGDALRSGGSLFSPFISTSLNSMLQQTKHCDLAWI